jgi:hypothetical protein
MNFNVPGPPIRG